MGHLSAERLAAAGLRLEVDGGRATLTLDRPDRRNAQTPTTWLALADVVAALDGAVTVLVIRGEGPAFSAGIDRALFAPDGLPGEPSLPALAALPDDRLDATLGSYQRGFRSLRSASLVSVAAVQGAAIGAGFQLALACDLRVLADDASLCMREPALGLVPDLAGTKALVDLVGYARALEICGTARRVGAAEAATLGLATLVVPRADLVATVDDLVAALLATPPAALLATRALLRDAGGRGLDEQCAAERAAQVVRLRALAAGS